MTSTPALLLPGLIIATTVIAAPPDTTDVLLDAFENHRVVALGENHGHQEFHDWLILQLERPHAQQVIDDIIVEWGNALYQDVIDRYIAGLDVPWDSVTMAWRNTIVSPNTVWDAPAYAQFFQRIRRINGGLAANEQYRVILADSPVDWSRVDRREDLAPYFDRAASMAEAVRRGSLLKGRRSLFVAGGLHVSRLPRRRHRDDGVPIAEITPVAWLELKHPGSVYVIQSLGRAVELGLSELAMGGAPMLIDLSVGNTIGGILANRTTTLRNRDGTRLDVYGSATLADIVDAVILWDSGMVTIQEADSAAFQVDWYWDELNRRSQITRGGPMDPSLRSN